MRKCAAILAVLIACLMPLDADVTLVQTITIEGPAAAMMAPGQMPKTVMRIKGLKARSDVDVMGQTFTAITDLDAKQVIMLQPSDRTAQVITAQAVDAGAAPLAVPDIDVSLKATGKSQPIDGVSCDEHAFALKMSFAEFSQGQAPAGAAEMMKDVSILMNGTVWIARSVPGVEEYMAFNKAAMQSNLLAAVSGMKPGQSGGLDKLMAAAASAPGLPYLTEVTMTFEGSGPIVEAMKMAGPMKMIQKTSSVSTEAIPEDLFKVPEGYRIEK